MSLYCAIGSETTELSAADLKQALFQAFAALGDRRGVLALPPDFTRFHSRAGDVTRIAWECYGERLKCVMPALGTHVPMTAGEISTMFGDMPGGLFRVHDWRSDLATLGEVPAQFVSEQSEGKLDYTWPAQVNRILVDGGFDLILSIGQVVPHEVIGMANYNKNIFVGTGGSMGINRSHFLGAVYGMERIMGRADNPVRRVMNYASDHFATGLPIVYALTVIGKNAAGKQVIRGLYVGDDVECFLKASELSLKVNFVMLEQPLKKAVVFLDPSEFKSTWLGNKSLYRTRMALADGAAERFEKAHAASKSHPDILPRVFNNDEFDKDHALIEALIPIQAQINELAKSLQDTLVAANSDAMTQALEVYAAVKQHKDKVPGLAATYEELSVFFQRSKRKTMKVAA